VKMVLVHFNTLQIVFSKTNVPATCLGVMSRNAGDYLVQEGLLSITTEVFPKTKVMGHGFLSFIAKEYCQLVKR